MSARYIIGAAVVILFATALLYAVDHKSFVPAMAGGPADATDDTALAWAALRGDGHVALIRHAPAPGTAGDPSDYKLDDCTTQRNLSEQGRAEAQALGARFSMQQVKVGKVISSQ